MTDPRIVDAVEQEVARKKHMTDTLTVREKSNYGRTVYYPACDLAELFASIANTTTLTSRALRQIEEHGYTIEIERPTTKTWSSGWSSVDDIESARSLRT